MEFNSFRFFSVVTLGLVVIGGIPGSVFAQTVTWKERIEERSAERASETKLAMPDYSNRASWAAYPGEPSHVEDTPAGVVPEAPRDVDVFFIHPTTYLAPVIGNAAYDAKGQVGARVDDVVLKIQTSVFNACCRVFAPRYRQTSLRAITQNSPQAYAATDLAYSDIARAFNAFVDTEGNRRFIIASHSQGSVHAMRLLQEKIIGRPIQNQLLAAYIPGVSLPVDIEKLGLPICRTAVDQGCVMSWNSVRSGYRDNRRLEDAVIWWDGRYQPVAGRSIVCVNPLSWSLDGKAPASDNLGGVYNGGKGAPIPPPVPWVTGAECQNGLLGVDVIPDQRRHFSDILTLTGVYHDFDYGLYYMNIRANAVIRIQQMAR